METVRVAVVEADVPDGEVLDVNDLNGETGGVRDDDVLELRLRGGVPRAHPARPFKDFIACTVPHS